MVPLRDLSLRRKIPLAVSGLTVGALVLAGALSYLEVRQSALAEAESRLQSIVAELATMNVVQQAEREALEQRVAASPYVRAAIEGWMIDSLRLLELLDSLRAPAEFGMPVSILRADSTVAFLAGVDPVFADPDPQPPLTPQREIGPFRAVGDRVLYWLSVPVSGPGEPSGWIAQRRQISLQPGTAITTLLGDEVRVLFGIPTDTLWLDLVAGLVPVAPADVDTEEPFRVTRPDGGEALAVAEALSQGPWIAQADMPMSQVMERPRAFLSAALATGLLVALAAGFVAWLASGSLTRPITALVGAADAVAAGNYQHRVPEQGDDDELGRLARTFNTMAEELARSDEARRLQLEELRALAARLVEANVTAEQAREEAMVANRVKSEFLATMSHEIRTPINVVLSYVELLRAGGPDRPTPRQVEYLAQIDRSSQQLLWLLNDLLDYSMLESNQMRVSPETGSAREALHTAVAALEPSAQRKRIALTIQGGDALFHADQHRVQQVVLNLLSNAIRYTPEDGSVTLGCRLESEAPPEVGAGNGDWVRIDVQDTGPGVPKDQLARIFEPFVRCEDHAGGDRGGAGLGLAISQRLATMMSGTITLHTVQGEGSRFTLWLPAAPTRVQHVERGLVTPVG